MAGYLKIVAARKKRDDLKVQKLALGGFVGQVANATTNPLANAVLPGVGQFGAAAGGIPGINSYISGITDYAAGHNPLNAANSSFNASVPGIQSVDYQSLINQQSGFGGQLGATGQNGLANQLTLGNQAGQVGVNGLNQSLGYANQQAAQANQTYGQEQNLIQQLQMQAAGGGPGAALAQNMLNQATQANVAQGAGMIASQRGINPGLQARLIAQNTAATNQAAAGQGANLALQSQLNAQGQLGSLLGNANSLSTGAAANLYGNAANTGLGTANSAYGNVGNTGIGGLTNFYGTNVGANSAQNNTMTQGGLGAQQINAGVASGNQAGQNAITGGVLNAIGGTAAGYASGSAKAPAPAAVAEAHGGMIPGQSPYRGDDERNDTVKTDLSKGEIVLPLSITQHPDAPWLAAAFVQRVLAGKGPKPSYKKADGGEIEEPDEAVDSAAPTASAPPGPYSGYFQALGGQPSPPAPPAAPSAPLNPDDFGKYGADVLSAQSPNFPGFGTMARAQPLAPDQVPNANVQGNLDANGAGQASFPDPYAGAMDAFNQSFGEQRAGIGGMATAAQREAEAQKKAYQDGTAQIQQVLAGAQESRKKLDAENVQLQTAAANGNIDPTRFYSNLSTGNKITAAIGIALSGIGSGLAGQRNAALDIINRAIEQDIDAQKANLGKTTTLLSLNLQKYGRLDAATNATIAQIQSMVMGQIGAANAQAGGEKAAANAQMLTGQLDAQRVAIAQQVAQHQLGMQLGGGTYAGGAGGSRVNLEALPEEYRKRAVQLPNGGVALARDEKTAAETQTRIGELGGIDNQINDALQFMTTNGRTIPGSDADAVADSKQKNIALEIGNLHGLKRINDVEYKAYMDMVPPPGAWRQDKAKAQLMTLKQLIRNKQNAEFSTLEGGPGRASQSFQPVGH